MGRLVSGYKWTVIVAAAAFASLIVVLGIWALSKPACGCVNPEYRTPGVTVTAPFGTTATVLPAESAAPMP